MNRSAGVLMNVSSLPGPYGIGVFGKETKGLPEELLEANLSSCIRIPMVDGARSMNLCNSVAVILYEGLRQNEFSNMTLYGKLKDHIDKI